MKVHVTAIAATLMASTAMANESIQNPIEDYGYLWQFGLSEDHELDSDSCIPTSWANALVYIQNTYEAELNGLQIIPPDYEGWTQTALTLRSEEYMNTNNDLNSNNGTTGYYQATGFEKYLSHVNAASPTTLLQGLISTLGTQTVPPEGAQFPAWLLEGNPTFGQLQRWLESGAAVVININYLPDTHNGHAVVLTGLEWNDTNQDGIIQLGEATLSVVDPLDPSEGYGSDGTQAIGPTKKTFMNVFKQPETADDWAGLLVVRYDQYKGGFPFVDGVYETTFGVITGSGALLVTNGPLGACCVSTGCDNLIETQCDLIGGSWTLSGSCDDCAPPCPADNDNDGIVGIEDLLILIDSWGFCP